MVKCETKTCTADAVAKMYWPGKAPMTVCRTCGLRATNIAKVLGFHLVVEPLEQPALVGLIGLSFDQMFGG